MREVENLLYLLYHEYNWYNSLYDKQNWEKRRREMSQTERGRRETSEIERGRRDEWIRIIFVVSRLQSTHTNTNIII